uniref:hypothetical protein n=1 Tax=Klebsiella sp. TaxID=576 RepID=UPI0031DF2A1D
MKKIIFLTFGVFISNSAFSFENQGQTKPVRISCPVPVMPVKAQALKTEGTVNYAAWVNDKGNVYSVDIKGDEVFFRETRIVIKKCKFKPDHPGVYRDSIQFRLVKP